MIENIQIPSSLPLLLIEVIITGLGGFIFAKAIGKFIETIIRRKIDHMVPEFPLSKFFRRLTEWFIYIFIIEVILILIEFHDLANYILSVLVFYANAVIGIVIIISGYFIAKKTSSYFSPKLISDSLKFFILSLAVLTAVPFFGVKVDLLIKIFLVLFGSIVIGGAMAIGYGLYKNIQQALKEE